MTGWFPFAVTALVMMGSQRFLYKVAVERSCSTVVTTLSFMGTVTVVSATAFFLRGAVVEDIPYLLCVSLVNCLAFLGATLAHIEALKRLPAAIAYPLIRLDAVLVVLISLVFFHDRILGRQGLGIVLALAAAFLIARERGGAGPSGCSGTGFLFIWAAVLGGAAAAVSSRFAALHADKSAFMALSYGLSTLFTAGLGARKGIGTPAGGHRDAILIGMVMGLLNVVGYYSYLEGLARGPLSLVTVITSMHFMVAVLLSLLIYRERLTRLRAVGIAFTVISLALLRA
jgi:drug/metabolite transporter (DMT)-like permease